MNWVSRTLFRLRSRSLGAFAWSASPILTDAWGPAPLTFVQVYKILESAVERFDDADGEPWAEIGGVQPSLRGEVGNAVERIMRFVKGF